MSGETLNAIAADRLTRAMGPTTGTEVLEAGLVAIGRKRLDSPADLLALAEFLIERRGLFEAVGRGLKVTALLRGAPAA